MEKKEKYFFPPSKNATTGQTDQKITRKESIFVVAPAFVRNKEIRSIDGSFKKLILINDNSAEQAFVRQECHKYQSIEPKHVYVGMFQLRAKDFGSVNFSHNGNKLEKDANWQLLYTIKKELTDEQKEDVKNNLKHLYKSCKQYDKYLKRTGKLREMKNEENITPKEPETSQSTVTQLSTSIESTLRLSSNENSSRQEKSENIDKTSEISTQKVDLKKSTKETPVIPKTRFKFGRQPRPEQQISQFPVPLENEQPTTSSSHAQPPRHRFHFGRMPREQKNVPSTSSINDNNSNDNPKKEKRDNNDHRSGH